MLSPQTDVPLAQLTTLELGGPARYFVRAEEDSDVLEAIAWAHERGVQVWMLGGGSNVLVPDEGLDGLVVHIALTGCTARDDGDAVRVEAAAGEPWDAFVADTVARGWTGLECLSGIPGLVGATPIQNVGAYGQEVADTITSVRVLDRVLGRVQELAPSACGFGYRDSALRRDPARAVVLSVTFRLVVAGLTAVRYVELARALGEQVPTPSFVRETVLELRARKSMVLRADDENRRSVGSFFVNPVVADADADRVVALALTDGLVASPSEVPRWPTQGGRTKLAAAWLVEQAGFPKGARAGAFGISSRHSLALVHHGGGRTADLLAFAEAIRGAVLDRFGVTLQREPVVLGVA